jgi:hypothetical protein
MGAVKSWKKDDLNPGEVRPSSGATTLFATSLLVLSLLTLSACMTVPKGRGDYDTG